ncbi:MAG: flagellar biosynthetic protein FliQ [Planctomycetota bacterium]|jgi:flagellar biosynthetic protein FliQ|nr:flagellar biosynthetic protein FliQ [Planctomycetota bacterium]
MIPDVQDIIDVAHNMLWICLLMSMPTLITALVVGVAVSLLQTVTSIQEMTLTFVPKLVAVVTVAGLALPWLIDTMSEYYFGIMRMFSSFYE